jgi:hypothetical protein
MAARGNAPGDRFRPEPSPERAAHFHKKSMIHQIKSKMKRTILIIHSVIVALAFSGCTTNLSRNSLVKDQLNRKLKIQRECLLASGQKSWDEVREGDEDWFRGAPYQLYDKDPASNTWRKSGWIKPGTELTINKVVYNKSFETDYIDVYGTLYLDHRNIPFWYSWRYLSSSKPALKRAPWEGDDVPEKRPLKEH